jgi:membrane-associated protease RseP (regulator of RpoE activity)
VLQPQILFAAEVLLAIWILAAIHVTAITAAGFVSGVSIRQISFGVGPRLLQFRKCVVRAFPFAGWVKFKDALADECVDTSAARTSHDAYNHQLRIVQAAIPLAGPASLVAVALVLGYERSLSEVLTGFRQIFAGSLQPLSVAQAYISATQSFAANGGFGVLTAVLAAKLAAFNLVPLPMLNGGQALLALLRKPGDEPAAWETSLLKWAMLPWCALLLCWLVAFVYYVVRT